MERRQIESIGEHGELAPGPPWIFGWRGAPREAPENSLASLERAVGLGLDGVAYDVRACAGGELVLLADATLDRTTDGSGALAVHSPKELHELDAGSWFGAEFSGEPLAWLDSALALRGNAAGTHPQHLIELREPELLPALAARLAERGQRLSVRVATARRSVALEARDLGLAPLLELERPTERDRAFARDEALMAIGARFQDWRLAGPTPWDCERFCFDVDDPHELLAACRTPFNALTTTEPRRALAIRALVHLAPEDRGGYPLRVGELTIGAQTHLASQGEWCGVWQVELELRNPFAFEVLVELSLVVRRGAFDAPALPQQVRMGPGESVRRSFGLSGGSWSPGGDPLLAARFALPEADGGARPFLVLDAPLVRRRSVRLLDRALRLPLLRETPREPAASVTVRRHRRDLLAALENPGDLTDARVVVHLDGRRWTGARGVRLALPEDIDTRPGGVPFSVGIVGWRATPRGPRSVVRRWSGGLPDTLAAGEPGRLLGTT